MTTVLVCLKWSDHRPEVEPVTGSVSVDDRSSGPSPADRSALEWALRLGEHLDAGVTAVTVGTAGSEVMLRDALAVGAARAVRIDADPNLASRYVARLLAAVEPDATLVCCGLHSLDRGSGSVPAFVAHDLGVPQALGLVTVETGMGGRLVAERRLDHGRRERLAISGRCVLSFEAGPELRRAPLAAVMTARTATVDVVSTDALGVATERGQSTGPALMHRGPFRPRAKIKPAPAGSTRERVAQLVGSGEAPSGAHLHEVQPGEAADIAVAQLIEWGYLNPTDDVDGSGADGPAAL